MGVTRHIALLRGINVGGRNPVAMAELRGVFEAEGYAAVGTYIQSGNVIFETAGPVRSLETDLEGTTKLLLLCDGPASSQS